MDIMPFLKESADFFSVRLMILDIWKYGLQMDPNPVT